MKQSNRNPWDVLGISSNASQEEIKAAFKQLALKYHPDKNGDNEQFRLINNAYNKLKNKQMVPIIESSPTRMINLNLSIDQQINGINDYVKIEDDIYIKVKIPPGSLNNDKYRIYDNGQTFIINVQEKIDPTFKRYGLSLTTDYTLDVVTAMTGGIIEIKSPEGTSLSVDIPSGISHNEIITVPNVGLLNRKKQERGSLFITIKIDIPQLKSQQEIDDFISRLKNVRN